MELVFREEDHSFWLGDRRLPSVTQILKHFIPRWECDEWYLERGKAVHKATELYDKGILDTESVDSQLEGYLQAWIKFREDYHFTPDFIEHKTHHPIYGYAGIIDREGLFIDRIKEIPYGPTIIDIKSGEPSLSDRLQIAGGYCGMLPGRNGFPLYLHSDGTYTPPRPYSPKEIREAQNAWLSMSTTFNYLMKEGIITWNQF